MSRVFSGIRPSGQLHLGNYLGAIKNWIALQKKHQAIFAIVDYHALTTPFDVKELRANVHEVALDYLAVGLDPKRATLMVQSQVPEHLELAWIFSCISPLSWFEKIPTYKEKIALHPKHVHLGLLGYPALMAADILIYKADLVPVGEDQLPHIEMTNMIGKRFNNQFGKVFPEIKVLSAIRAGRIMSLKNPLNKMSKTGDEGIALSDSPDEIKRKIKRAVTDSGSTIKMDPKKPAITNLLTIYSEVSGKSIKALEKKYKGKGYGDFKKDLASAVIKFLQPIQKRRSKIGKGEVEKVLASGSAKARKIAQKTLGEVKRKIGLI